MKKKIVLLYCSSFSLVLATTISVSGSYFAISGSTLSVFLYDFLYMIGGVIWSGVIILLTLLFEFSISIIHLGRKAVAIQAHMAGLVVLVVNLLIIFG